jgi:putative ABC transport system permease protein
VNAMNTIWQDLRFSARMLMAKPGFTLVAVMTLALGIGANTAIFSVVNAVLLKALPFAAPERLVAIGATKTNDRLTFGLLSYPDFVDFRSQNQAFERLAAFRTRGFTLIGHDGAVRLRGAIAGADLFPILGVGPLHGRTFTPAEDIAGGGRSVILSYKLWQSRFDADPNVVGKTVPLNGESYTIVAVMPQSFQFPIEAEPVELWTNFARDTENIGIGAISFQRGNRYLNAVGQLKPNVSPAQAEAQLMSIASQLEQQYPNDNKGFSVSVTPMLERLTGKISRSLWVIFAAVALVLLIACANVASLLLARALNRRHEIAVRIALGASRWHVIRLSLTESVLLALVGGAAGVLVASLGMDALIAITPQEIPRIGEASLDSRVLLFTLAIALLTGVVLGLVPALQASRFDLQSGLKEGRKTTRSSAAIRNVFVVGQVTISLVLLAGAGLLIQSFARMVRVDPGFNTEHLLTMRLGLGDGPYSKPDQIAGFHDRLMESLASVPGVSAYSTVNPLPMLGSIRVGFNIEGRPNEPGRNFPYETRLFLVGEDYFRTMGIAVIKGREYMLRDGLYSVPVAIVNEAFARRFFADQKPIGQRINPAMSADDRPLPMREIVGVVADARSGSLTDSPEPEVYLHIPQCPATSTFTILLRTRNDAEIVTAFVRETVAKLDRQVPLYQIRSFESYVDATLTQPRYNTLLMGVFAGVALLLTAIGLYGVISFSMSQRTQEIGVRMALGAQRRHVVRVVLVDGLRLIVVGVVLGLGGSLALTRVMKQLLFGVSATDPPTFILVSLLLISVALLACWIPARRATKVDPMIALRHE